MSNPEIRTLKDITFVDVSTMVEGAPGRGHLHDFHFELVAAAKRVFKTAIIVGPIAESNPLITPVFRAKHFRRGLGTFFPNLYMNEDLQRMASALDGISGTKVLHFYEGGFRDLVFLSRIMNQRKDIISVFNFFALDPWFTLISKANPFGFLARIILRKTIFNLEPSTAFTFDSIHGLGKFRESLAVELGSVYPLFSSLQVDKDQLKAWDRRKNTFLFAPRTRSEKKLVSSAITAVASNATKPLSIAIVSRWKSSFDEAKVKKLGSDLVKVRVYNGGLEKSEYTRLFLDTRAVVLPYLDSHYVYGSSGKLLDAQIAGCLAIAPSWTAAGALVSAQSLGEVFHRGAASLSSVLLSIDLNQGPSTLSSQPDLAWAVSQLGELLASLEPNNPNGLKNTNTTLLPALVGPLGLRWVLVHLVASPAKVALDRIRE